MHEAKSVINPRPNTSHFALHLLLYTPENIDGLLLETKSFTSEII